MSYKMFVGVFTAILSLALATGTAWANDPIVSTVKTKVSLPSQNPAAGSTQNLSLVSRGTGQASPLGANENSTHSTLYEGANWNRGSVITWSIADSPGTADSPFSGYMGSQYEALVQQAFQTWAVASGLTFEKVADTNQSDIRLGWGDFNTSSTGVVGHTSCQAQSGQLLPGVIIRLEDPAQDSLVAGTGNTLTYSGTDANLYQVILHEIGHALGLADNDDPNSVMYYEATGANNTLARNDVAGIQTLYGSPTLATQALQAAASELSGTSMNSMIKQLNQATASF
jgi:predicted Zn-dependent protease